MKSHRIGQYLATILSGLILAACSKPASLLAPDPTAAGLERSSAGAPSLEFSRSDDREHREFSPWSTNRFFPLIPGTVFHYRSETPDGVETQTVTITNETQRIEGVNCRVVRDVVKLDGEVIERTRDYYAMDREGNVWYFGEDTRSIDPETGEVSTEGSWRSGRDGAEKGILMEAHPAVGDEYNEENYPGVAEDKAKVVSLSSDANVPAGKFDDCLETNNFTPLEPGVSENKFYAPRVGLVSEVDNEDGVRNELVRVTRAGSDHDDDEYAPWANAKKWEKRRR